MKIERINIHALSVKLGFQYSVGLLDTCHILVWEVVAGPFCGFGECGWSSGFADAETAPTDSTTAANTSTLMAQGTGGGRLVPADRRLLSEYAGALLGRDPLLLTALLPDLPAEYDGRALVLREGLSIALYDLAGHILQTPVHTLLGGRRRDRSPGMPVVHVAPPSVMARRATAWANDGYRFLKLKLAGEMEADLERVAAVRGAIGQEIQLQVDANEGYTEMEQAERAVNGLQRFNIDFFEDMLAAPVASIAQLRKRTGARIMVDREAFWPNVYEVCRSGAADIVNHHPDLQGGLDTALRIDAVALAAGIPTAVGSSGVVGIQNAAYQTLSSVIGLTRPCEDIGLLPYFSGPTQGEYTMDRAPNVVVQPYTITAGCIEIPDAPGLGIEVDRHSLETLTVDTLEVA